MASQQNEKDKLDTGTPSTGDPKIDSIVSTGGPVPSFTGENIGTSNDEAKLDPSGSKAKGTKKKIEVDEDVLKGILSEIRELKEKTSEFEKTATQDQIRKIDALRAKGKLVKAVKLRRFNGDLVLGWKTTTDDVWMADGRLHEVQNVKVFTEGGEFDTTLVHFNRVSLYEPYEVVAESRDQDGAINMTVITKDGRKIVINNKYVN